MLSAAASARAATNLLVAMRSTGAVGAERCLEATWHDRGALAEAFADRSESMDRWARRHRLREIRALFPRGNGLRDRRQAIRGRLENRGPRRPHGSGRARDDAAMAFMDQAAARLAQVYTLRIESDQTVAEALRALRADVHVDFAQIDHGYSLDQAQGDPFLESAGSWGQSFADLWNLDEVRAREAWTISRGEGTVVAVVDTGLDYEHPDIAANVWVNPGEDLNGNGVVDDGDWNGVDDDGNGFVDDLRGYDFSSYGDDLAAGDAEPGDPDPMDERGHGTHVAGTIAAVADNGIGIAGVAPEARIMPLKGFGTSGSARDSDLWTAVLYAIENGADVVNASWSCAPNCPDNPLARAVLEIAHEMGVVFVTSAGNNAQDVVNNQPENFPKAITVGSVGVDLERSSFSNQGWLVDLVAPGGGGSRDPILSARRNILSLAASNLLEQELPFVVEDDYLRLAGTSMAAPHVAGAVALLLAVHPEMTPPQILSHLKLTARDLGLAGTDPTTGAGLLDLYRLLSVPPLDLDLGFEEPIPGRVLDARTGVVQTALTAAGRDVARYSLAVAEGLRGDDFRTLEVWTEASGSIRESRWIPEPDELGTSVLRLRAELSDGRTIDAMNVVGLERIRPIRLSQGTDDETAPELDGRRVVWQAADEDVRGRSTIRTGGFDPSGAALPPAALPVAEHRTAADPRLSGRRIVWRERDHEVAAGGPETLIGCRLRFGRRGISCRPRALAREDGRIDPYAFGQGVVAWSRRTPLFEIFGCLWRGSASCKARPIDDSIDSGFANRVLDVDRSSVLSKTNAGGAPLRLCHFEDSSLACRPVGVDLPSEVGPRIQNAAFDGPALVLEWFTAFRSLIGYCDLDRDSGLCPLRLVEAERSASDPDVSARRIVWTERVSADESWLSTCEIDPVSGDCPARRITGAPYPASHARLVGHRLVWQDAREGAAQVFGLELPRLFAPDRVTLRPNRPLHVWIRARGGVDDPVALSIEPIEGSTPEEMSARLEPRGTGRWRLSIPAGETLRGPLARWRLRGTAESRIDTQLVLEINGAKPPKKEETPTSRVRRQNPSKLSR